MSARPENLLRLGTTPDYPPGYPEKNKRVIDPIHAEINRLMKTGMPFMTAAKQAMREAAAAAAPK
jgi:hypothetical protein